MRCPQCTAENPAGARFCSSCGAPLALACAACGQSNPPGSRFCNGCGQSLRGSAPTAPRFAEPGVYTPSHLAERILTGKAAVEGERKQVTVLFADLRSSMELIADRDPEEARKLLDPVLEHMMEAVHRYEGTVNQVMGDGIMALFGAPLALEDHAVRACYAALRMQEALKRYAAEVQRSQGFPIQIRVGMNSGEVVVRSIGSDLRMDYTAVGQTTHLAARMEQTAMPGSILVTAATLALAEGYVAVAPLGAVPVKGLAEPVEVFELTGAGLARTRLQAAAARGLTRFVGRDVELGAVSEALERAAAGRGQVVALIGEPGVGKSRLVWEVTHSRRTHGWLVLESGSVSYGKATAYLPIIDLLKAYFAIETRDDPRKIREKVTGKLLSLDETLNAMLPAFLTLLDVPVDDQRWHALDPSQRRRQTLDAVKRLLLRESQIQPLLVVFEDLHWIDGETQALLDSLVESLPSARLLLLVNYRPEYEQRWASKSYFTQLRLDPLPNESSRELLEGLIGSDPTVEPLKPLLIARTEGRPFFLEESVRSLVETGVLAGERGAYRLAVALPDIQVPATVHAILAARIDRLAQKDKRLLQSAAVIGKDVPFNLLAAIVDESEEELRRSLESLQAAEFLYETSLFPDLEYTFKHALTHEVAYGSVLQERRRDLHSRIVAAVERVYAGRLAEHVERLAHHAFRGEQWEQAVGFLRQAGAKAAAARSAYGEAAGYFEQAAVALRRLPPSRETLEQAIDIRFELRSSLQPVGDHERALEHLREAERLATELGERGRLGWASAYLSQYLWWMGDAEQAEAQGQRALAAGSSLGDLRLEVVANFFLGQGHFIAGDYPRAIDHSRRNVALLAGERAFDRFGLTGLPAVLSRQWLARSLAERGEFSEALGHAQEALSIADTGGQPYNLAVARHAAGYVHLVRGDLAEAIPLLERAARVSKTWDLRLLFAPQASTLGWAYALSGRMDEARAILEESAAFRVPAFFLARWGEIAQAAGSLLVGKLAEAAAGASAAAEAAAERGFRGDHAHALALLGEISARRDPPDVAEAEDRIRRALALADELGMRPLAAHCHLDLGALQRRRGEDATAQQELMMAAVMFRDMDMGFWLSRAEAELRG